MLIIILFAICLCFTAEMLLLGGNAFGIVACVIAIMLLILGFLKKRTTWMTAIGMLLIAVCMIGVASNERESYIFTYSNSLEIAQEYMLDGKAEEAIELLETIEASYGQTAEVLESQAMCYMSTREYDQAIEIMKDYPDKKSRDYYSLMEDIFELQEQEGKKRLYALRIEAANEHPSWLEMQMSAGVEQLEKKEFSSAQYYFKRAYYLDYDNGMPSYMLGLTAYYMGDYQNCLLFYNQALEKGVSDDVKEAIVSQMSIVQGDE